MAEITPDQHEEEKATGEELATTIFAVSISGVLAVICFMIVMGFR